MYYTCGAVVLLKRYNQGSMYSSSTQNLYLKRCGCGLLQVSLWHQYLCWAVGRNASAKSKCKKAKCTKRNAQGDEVGGYGVCNSAMEWQTRPTESTKSTTSSSSIDSSLVVVVVGVVVAVVVVEVVVVVVVVVVYNRKREGDQCRYIHNGTYMQSVLRCSCSFKP